MVALRGPKHNVLRRQPLHNAQRARGREVAVLVMACAQVARAQVDAHEGTAEVDDNKHRRTTDRILSTSLLSSTALSK